jgi:hypothetical protein
VRACRLVQEIPPLPEKDTGEEAGEGAGAGGVRRVEQKEWEVEVTEREGAAKQTARGVRLTRCVCVLGEGAAPMPRVAAVLRGCQLSCRRAFRFNLLWHTCAHTKQTKELQSTHHMSARSCRIKREKHWGCGCGRRREEGGGRREEGGGRREGAPGGA